LSGSYLESLNTTAVHSHGALFGVYGLLALGLVLFVLRRMQPEKAWKPTFIAISFWAINIGLGLMIVLSLLPVGLLQTWASIEHGMWYARSAEFLQQPIMEKMIRNWFIAVKQCFPASPGFSAGIVVLE